MAYVFNKKIDSVLAAAGGQKVETVLYETVRDWIDYESDYLREFCGDGRYVEKVEKIQRAFFTFVDGGIMMEAAGKGRVKISSIVGDEIEIEADAFKNSGSVKEILDLFDTPELRSALEEKAVQEEAKAERERKAKEEREAARRQEEANKAEMQAIAKQAFNCLHEKKVVYNCDGNEVHLSCSVNKAAGWNEKRRITLTKSSPCYRDNDESVSFDINEVWKTTQIRPHEFSDPINIREWFPEGVTTLKEFYEYIISY